MKTIISIYKGSIGHNFRGYSSFEEVLKLMTHSADLQALHERLREAKRNTPTEYKRIKENECPAFIIGQFPAQSRKDKDCQQYFPLLGFDIDSMGFEAIVDDAIKLLRNCPHVRAAYPSPSREGIRIFVQCDATPETHKAHYEAVSAYLSDFLGIPTDKQVRKELSAQGLNKSDVEQELKRREHLDSSTSNIARLWFYSYVPESMVYHNPHSYVFSIPTTPAPAQRPIKKTTIPQTHTLNDDLKIELCLDKVNRQNIPGGRNNFAFAAACEMARFGVSSDAALSALLQYEQSDFDQAEIKKTLDSAYKAKSREYSDQQIMKYARMLSPGSFAAYEAKAQTQAATGEGERAAVEPDQVTDNLNEDSQGESENTEKSKFLRIKKYISDHYEFRRNLVSLDIEAKRKTKNSSWQILNENDLFCELMEAGFTGVENPALALIKSSFVRDYDPFLEYFQSLPAWSENDPDYISNLANYVKAKDRVWFNQQFKKMLVRTVACSIGRIPFNKHCFVFKSGQNDGKSSFIRFLCPDQLADYMTDFIDMESKDGRIALCQNLIINLDELSVFSKSDVKKAKALFTIEKIKERLPYDRKASMIKRRASFIASTNEDEFLVDETGNVRWLVFEIEGIQHDNGRTNGYNANVDINQVYSQAYSLLQSGFEMHLTKEEIAKSENNNQTYQIATVEQELIQKHFAPGSKADPESEFMTATELMTAIQDNIKTTLYKNQVGRALKVLGFEQSQKHDRRTNYQLKGYYVRRLSNESTDDSVEKTL